MGFGLWLTFGKFDEEGAVKFPEDFPQDTVFEDEAEDGAVSDEVGAYLWDPKEDNVKEVPIQAFARGVKSLAFSRDGKLLATGAASGTGGAITLWDIATLKPKRTLDQALGAAVAFSRDGKLLASAEDNNRVHLWDVESGEQLAEDHAMMGPLYDVALAPDDNIEVESVVPNDSER